MSDFAPSECQMHTNYISQDVFEDDEMIAHLDRGEPYHLMICFQEEESKRRVVCKHIENHS